MSPLIVEGLNVTNPEFQKAYISLPSWVTKEAHFAIGSLVLIDLLRPPARLHLHQLADRYVVSHTCLKKKVKVYTINLNRIGSHVASFTFEQGVAFMRTCGTYEKVNHAP